MAARRLLRSLSAQLICALFAISTAMAFAARLRVQTVNVAGFAYHQGKGVWGELREGDVVTLTHERDNAHDPLAVRVDWQGRTLGYLPREQSAPIASALDRGTALTARIAQLREHPNPRERIRIEVFAEL